MSNKKRKTQKSKAGTQLAVKKSSWTWVVVLEVLVLIGLVALLLCLRPETSTGGSTQPSGQPSVSGTDPTGQSSSVETGGNAQLEQLEEVTLGLGDGLVITDIGSYTGVYVEDGSDETVSRIMMIVLTNNSDKPLQYAEITLAGETGEAKFSASTVPAGESVVLLEQSRMAYESSGSFTEASAQYVVFFEDDLSLNADKLEIKSFDGVLNVTNTSGADIAEDVVIYYKNSSADMLYGGITYRVTITGGIKAGEVKQLIANHFTTSGSRIMFVTCG